MAKPNRAPLSPDDPRARITTTRIVVWIVLLVAGAALVVTGIIGIVSKS